MPLVPQQWLAAVAQATYGSAGAPFVVSRGWSLSFVPKWKKLVVETLVVRVSGWVVELAIVILSCGNFKCYRTLVCTRDHVPPDSSTNHRSTTASRTLQKSNGHLEKNHELHRPFRRCFELPVRLHELRSAMMSFLMHVGFTSLGHEQLSLFECWFVTAFCLPHPFASPNGGYSFLLQMTHFLLLLTTPFDVRPRCPSFVLNILGSRPCCVSWESFHWEVASPPRGERLSSGKRACVQ